MNFLSRIYNFLMDRIFGCPSKFKKGDTVQRVSGGPLMVVTKVATSYRNQKSLLFKCTWFDRDEKIIKNHFFMEAELKHFDWYNPS